MARICTFPADVSRADPAPELCRLAAESQRPKEKKKKNECVSQIEAESASGRQTSSAAH